MHWRYYDHLLHQISWSLCYSFCKVAWLRQFTTKSIHTYITIGFQSHCKKTWSQITLSQHEMFLKYKFWRLFFCNCLQNCSMRLLTLHSSKRNAFCCPFWQCLCPNLWLPCSISPYGKFRWKPRMKKLLQYNTMQCNVDFLQISITLIQAYFISLHIANWSSKVKTW